jgi:predicted AlkP superfamily pyrophosphatase or phosphodiesterase
MTGPGETAPGRTRALWSSPIAQVVVISLLVSGTLIVSGLLRDDRVPSFRRQACSMQPAYLERIKNGYMPGRSGQIQVVPRSPIYFSSGAGGWSHSGPWAYLQDVPLVFYGPGIVPEQGDVSDAVTLADVAPTIAALLGIEFDSADGGVLEEVIPPGDGSEPRGPKLVVTIVWDGGGWNTLEQWPDSWPVLKRLMSEGVSYANATVGSNPSVTPSIHTTLGTGSFPSTHGITDIPVFDGSGSLVDAFNGGDSSRLMEVPAFAEFWDEANDNNAMVGMIGYEPWHLGMIGWGAERDGGDHDDAVWLDTDTNEWKTNPDHYRLPASLPATTPSLDTFVKELDAADGAIDNAWGEHDILDDRSRLEESPAFIAYHGAAMRSLIQEESYGADRITDLLFTNFKQIDRVGHYFNMVSEEVRDSVAATDRELGLLVEFLDARVGRGDYVLVITADHGQQPDAADVGGYGINPREVLADVEAEFGDIVLNLRPTQMYLDEQAMRREGVSTAEVARFLAGYRLRDNTSDPRTRAEGSGDFGPGDRVFSLAAPSDVLEEMQCEPR